METDAWLAGISGRMTVMRERADELTERVAAATGVARSSDGAVTVELGANGGLLNIEFGKEIADRTPVQLAELVMRTAHAAQRAVADQVAETLGEFGEDGELMNRFLAHQPPMDAEEQRELDASEQADASFGLAPTESNEDATRRCLRGRRFA